MISATERSETGRFRALLARRLGLQFEDARLPFLWELLRRRSATARDIRDYLEQLENDRPRTEIPALARELTVTETYFLRHEAQFRALAATASRAGTGGPPLRILSAGCASGEEPYSIVILLHEQLRNADAPSVRAVDVNPDMIERARAGRYGRWSLRETPDDLRARWFRNEGGSYRLHESIRSAVSFEVRNLAEDNHDLFLPNSFDVVFCRNVLMYFTRENARALVTRIARALVPGGLLFLGYAETLRGLSSEFHLCATDDAFYYRRKHSNDGLERDGAVALTSWPRSARLDADWVAVIGGASERIAMLARAHRSDGSPSAMTQANAVDVPAQDLAPVYDLLQQEQFAEALALVEALPGEVQLDRGTLLLRALLLTHAGRLQDATLACDALLARDAMNAGAHYLLALCHEAQLNCVRASENYRIAIYLDPGFAMARLRLGLLARRDGDLDAARRELVHARILLQREEAARLQLFAGGFERGALLALCEAELLACGDTP